MFRKIMIATDLTAKSNNALRLAISLARGLPAELFALHVVPLPTKLKRWPSPPILDNKSYQLILRSQIVSAEFELTNQIRGLRWKPESVHLLVKVGDPSTTIATVAKELGIDVIVIARGSGGVLGSVTERIVRLAGQTVLIAPVKWPWGIKPFSMLPVGAFKTFRSKASTAAHKSEKKKQPAN
jgi:nucleotide-binding universal stress UspA family protein